VQIKVEPEGSPRREVEQEVHDVKFNTDGKYILVNLTTIFPLSFLFI